MKKKKKRIVNPFIRGFLGCVAFFMIIGMCASFMLAAYLHEKVDYQKSENSWTEPLKEDGVKNILLIGNDSRTDDSDGRSDAMILVSISNKTHSIHLTSMLRDIYVEIPGHEGNRLNAAYAFGGPELLMETLEENFDIEVNRYMLVNFQAFVNLVDAVGGVTLELTNEEVQYINGYLVEYNRIEGRSEGTDYLDASSSGEIHLNGPQALAFCRNRHIGSDFARTKRQRKVISAAVKNVPVALLKNGSDFIDGIMENVTTNLSSTELTGLVMQAPLMLCYDKVSGSIPLAGTYSNANIRGMAVLELDFDANKAYIQENIYGK